MLSIYLILTKIAVKSVLAEIENASTFGSGQIKTDDQTKPGLGSKKLRIDQKKLEQLHLCQATLEQIMDPSDEEFQKTFDKVCFRKSWKNHMLYLNKVRSSLSWTFSARTQNQNHFSERVYCGVEEVTRGQVFHRSASIPAKEFHSGWKRLHCSSFLVFHIVI